MDIQNQVKNIIIQQGGIAKSADFDAAGISAVQVVSLCIEGFLEHVTASEDSSIIVQT